jgi:hypothetical protein
MAFVYGFDAVAWGETWIYSADTNALPFHPRPNPTNLGDEIHPLQVVHNGSLQQRATTRGMIQVDTTTHVGQYVPGT